MQYEIRTANKVLQRLLYFFQTIRPSNKVRGDVRGEAELN